MSAALGQIESFISQQNIDTSAAGWKTRLPRPPKAEFGAGETWYWDLDTNHGRITVKLMQDIAPMHVSSTVYLTKLGFYDGLKFHRVIKRFMAQGGCPLGTGTGGPGYQYSGEFSPTARHTKGGLLSMANAGPNTDGSQFFLTFVATGWLDDKHSIFGEVVAGMDVVGELEARGSESGRTSEELRIDKASIRVE